MANRILQPLLIVAMAIAFLWVSSVIAIEGRVYFHEPILAILVAEMVMLVGIAVYGAVLFVRALRRH